MKTIAILLWEQERRTRVGVLFIWIFLGVYAFLSKIGGDLFVTMFSKNENMAIGTSYVAVLGVLGLTFLHEARHQLTIGFPRRVFERPLSVSSIFFTQIVYKIFIVSVTAVLAALVTYYTIDDAWSWIPGVLLFGGLVLALEAFTVLVCAFGAGTGTAIFVPIMAISLLAFSPIFTCVESNVNSNEPKLHDIDPKALGDFQTYYRMSHPDITQEELDAVTIDHFTRYPRIGAKPWLGFLALFVYFSAISLYALKRARSEIPSDIVGDYVRKLLEKTERGEVVAPHASAMAAQRWLEWKRMTYLFPWVSLIVTIGMAVALYGSNREDEARAMVTIVCLALGPLITAAIFGYLMTRTDRKYIFFVAGRPLNSAMLGRAKLLAGLKALAMSYALTIVTYIVLLYALLGETNFVAAASKDLSLMLDIGGTTSQLLPFTASMLFLSLVATWTLLWLARSIGFVVWLAGSVGFAVFHFVDDRLTFELNSDVSAYPPVFIAFGSAAAILSVVFCFLVFLFSAKKGFVNIKGLAIAAVVWVVLIALSYPVLSQFGTTSPVVYALFAIPLLPFVALPATLEWQRHRV